MFLSDRGGEDRNNWDIVVLVESRNPLHIWLKDFLIYRWLILDDFEVADVVEVDLSKDEQDSFCIWGLSYFSFDSGSLGVIGLHQPLDRFALELQVLDVGAVNEHLDERVPKGKSLHEYIIWTDIKIPIKLSKTDQ